MQVHVQFIASSFPTSCPCSSHLQFTSRMRLRCVSKNLKIPLMMIVLRRKSLEAINFTLKPLAQCLTHPDTCILAAGHLPLSITPILLVAIHWCWVVACMLCHDVAGVKAEFLVMGIASLETHIADN
eukprot:GGOE01001669.1.p3 GENE.GGOE01001669.1~~GGOE01001669.1.p3  ORF type:complete len:127 (-),score=5.58 GGOE01001669.1:23-403(-)